MKPLLSIVPMVVCFLSACGPDGQSFWGDCYETATVCVERETPEKLSSKGNWEGTYHTDRYFVGVNNAYLDWYGGTWRLVLERDDVLREPFYRTSSMVGQGTMYRRQSKFKAPYSGDETWYLSGAYTMTGSDLYYRGRISTHGKTIGSFEMSRPQQCLTWEERIRNTCDGTVEVRRNGELISIEEPPVDEGATPPVISYANVTPNPVTTGSTVDLIAGASSSSAMAWTVTFAHTATTNADLPEKTFTGKRFYSTMRSPEIAGTYLVTFEAKNVAGSDVATVYLTVNP